MTGLRTRRVYDPPDADGGTRILVDRLWPRGLAKDRARIDLWLKDIAPSDALRKRFHAQPDLWDGFRAAYAEELTGPAAQAAARTVFERLESGGTVTLLYAARDARRNNAIALKMWLERRDGGSRD